MEIKNNLHCLLENMYTEMSAIESKTKRNKSALNVDKKRNKKQNDRKVISQQN